MDPFQKSRFKSEPKDSHKEIGLSNVLPTTKSVAWTRRGLQETDDDVPRPVSGRGTNVETENKVSSGPDNEAIMHMDEIAASVDLYPSSAVPLSMDSSYANKHPLLVRGESGVDDELQMLTVSINPTTSVVDADTNDAYEPVVDDQDLSNETPSGLRDTVVSGESNGSTEYAIQTPWLRVVVPLMMTPFSVGGIILCLYAISGSCNNSSMCNIQRRGSAVIGSIMVVIPQALVQLIVLTTRGNQWGYWCSFSASVMFEGAGLLISLLVALSTPIAFDVLGDWLLAVSVQSISWYFTTWAICVRAKKHGTGGRKTRESDIFLNRKENGDCLGLIAAYLMYTANAAASRTLEKTTTTADFASNIFLAIGSSIVGILSCCMCRACCEHIGELLTWLYSSALSLFCCLEDDVIDNHSKECGCLHFEEEDNGKRGAPAAERLIWYISPLLLIEVPALLRAGSREGVGMVFAYSLMMIYSLSSLVIDCGMLSFFREQVARRTRSPLDSDEVDEEVGESNIVDSKNYSKIEVITLPTGRLGVYFKSNKRTPAKVSRFESFSPLVGVLEEGKKVVSLYIPGDELHTNLTSVELGKLLADSSHVASRELTVCCESTRDEEEKETEAADNEKEHEKSETRVESVTLPSGRLGVYFKGTKKSGVKVSRFEPSSPLVGELGEGDEVVSLIVPGDSLYSDIGSRRLGKVLSETSSVMNRKLKVRKSHVEPFAIIDEEQPDSDGGDSELSC